MSELISTNPSKNYEVIGKVKVSTKQEVIDKVAKAHRTKKTWQQLGVTKRAQLMQKLVIEFEKAKEALAKLIAKEMGMPIIQAREDVEFGLEYLASYADSAEKQQKPILTLETDKEIHTVVHEPYGVAACIAPWNFPFGNFAWVCGQNLVTGNVVIFKHSEETPLCGKFIEDVVTKILPSGVFQEVYGAGNVGEILINQDVNLICFTGSTKTGAKINQAAAPRFIRTSMELGGSAPGIVFEDCDVDEVAEHIFENRFINCGQMCDALKRLIVHESKFEEVKSTLLKIIANKKVGDASNETTDIGPLVAERQLKLLEEQVADAVAKGAKILVGGKRSSGLQGAYYEPTLIEDVTKDMRIWQEEVFGPVLPIVSFDTQEKAIRMANDTQYGLGAYVFTKSKKRFEEVAAQLESGMVSQNNVSYVNTCNFFGGYKMSGGGREHAQFGFDELTQTKVIAEEK